MGAMIFIVDDDDAARDSLRLLLECEGFEAREFVSGRQFLDAGLRDDGDCLILDVHMPGMNGLELIKELRKRGKRLPVILITGRRDAATINLARALGVPLVEKPYKAEEILNHVRHALDFETRPTMRP